jgi:hypothetical protein
MDHRAAKLLAEMVLISIIIKEKTPSDESVQSSLYDVETCRGCDIVGSIGNDQ